MAEMGALRTILLETLMVAFCSWTPKFFNPVRLLVLRVYGATITGTPFVHSKARIQIPWHLTMHHRALLSEKERMPTRSEQS